MKTERTHWTKKQLHTYIFLLCANADGVETDDEIEMIRSKIHSEEFEKIYGEFTKDTEEERFEKVQDNIALHEYSHNELLQLKKEMREVFNVDRHYAMMEHNLNRILNNMLY